MRALIQRVSSASVTAPDHEAATGPGLMILLGVRSGDTAADAKWLAQKCAGLRIFEDNAGKMNLSLLDTGGAALVVSQFTLYGNADRGKRPSFTEAARPEIANELYETFVTELRAAGIANVRTGVFQAMMQVTIVNEGPVTLMIESRGTGGGGASGVLEAEALGATPESRVASTSLAEGSSGFGRALYSGPPILLASQSPRRAEILMRAGIPFEIVKIDVDETPALDATPKDVALELAVRKAKAAAEKHSGRLLLTADTVVDIDGELLNKPVNHADARRMLEKLSGKTHTVHTGVALVRPDGKIDSAVETTRVTFRGLTPAEYEQYIATSEPMDKAGAYGIQGLGACLIDRIDGSYENVVGLPLARVIELLRKATT